MWQIITGNNVDHLRQFPDNHFDSIVTDPPYGIAFLGKSWDSRKATETTSKIAQLQNLPSGMAHTSLADDLEFQYWMRDVFAECLRVLKPGGHLLAFSAARTYHHMAMAAQTAGFEIRDQLMWIYSSGFPKSQDIGRSIQRSIGVEQYEQYDSNPPRVGGQGEIEAWTENNTKGKIVCTDPEAKTWEGWGTQLKPAHEPIVMARKPIKLSIARNCQTWGVGALHIDATRVPYENEKDIETYLNNKRGPMERSTAEDGAGIGMFGGEVGYKTIKREVTVETDLPELGRFPSNVIGDIAELYQKYFYCPKVSRAERHVGFDDPGPQTARARDENGNTLPYAEKVAGASPTMLAERLADSPGNNHPTVKPIELMKYLIKLVTPPGGHVLDPFNGSGSTGCAAVELDYEYTGIELDPAYVAIAQRRIQAWHEATHSNTFAELFE
jgi:site-specific DNA-methyltransferase (adenine-specific)